jgi:hypothetical protein
MKLPKHIRKELEHCLEDARDMIDTRLRQDVFLRETSWVQLDSLESLIGRAQSLLEEAKHGTR